MTKTEDKAMEDLALATSSVAISYAQISSSSSSQDPSHFSAGLPKWIIGKTWFSWEIYISSCRSIL